MNTPAVGSQAPFHPEPVKLFVGLLTSLEDLFTPVRDCLAEEFGAIDLESPFLPFVYTDYYNAEMGSPIWRKFFSFERLIDPAEIRAVKQRTSALEADWALREKRVRRPINLDPGYLSLGQLVLASTKAHAHRIYLGEGIYAEVTLRYVKGRFEPWPWTYPDYRTEAYLEFFGKMREVHEGQIRAMRARGQVLSV